jgi:Glycosyl hydrolase family 26
MTPPRTRRRRSAASGAIIPLACVAGALAGTFGVGVGASPAAAARIEVGVYQDDPAAGVPVLTKTVGRRATRVISTYVTGGKLVEPSVISLARRTRARLLVSWMPDSGKEGAKQPRYRLSRVRRGAQNRGLVALTKQLRTLRPAPILRPMPEPNTPWYAWSGTVNGNTPAAYVAAWKQVRRTVRNAGGKKIRLLWAPYARSVPATPENAIAAYFPGAAQVDLVGTSGYNFGAQGGLAWTEPAALFEDAYREISALTSAPFWIAETGSTALGGSKEQWIGRLGSLQAAIPNLAGLVWFDVRDRNGDFRIGAKKKTRLAFSKFVFRRGT